MQAAIAWLIAGTLECRLRLAVTPTSTGVPGSIGSVQPSVRSLVSGPNSGGVPPYEEHRKTKGKKPHPTQEHERQVRKLADKIKCDGMAVVSSFT